MFVINLVSKMPVVKQAFCFFYVLSGEATIWLLLRRTLVHQQRY
jgi:hypothetical protein